MFNAHVNISVKLLVKYVFIDKYYLILGIKNRNTSISLYL